MKKLIKINYLAAIILVINITACKKLDLAPEDYFGSTSYWKTSAQFENYMIGMHAQMRGTSTNQNDFLSNSWLKHFWLGEARGGTQRLYTTSIGSTSTYSSPFKDNAFNATTTGYSRWADYYPLILGVNLFIDQAEKSTVLDANKKGFLIGQAYGIRAFYYFMLYRTYGGVPLVTTPDAYSISDPALLRKPRATAKQTLDQIKADIEKSEQNFSADNFTLQNNSKGFWSKAATLMLKAEIYLWSAKVTVEDQKPVDVTDDVAKAEAALLAIKNSGKYDLMSNFSDIIKNEGNKEIIFSYIFSENDVQSDFLGTWMYNANFTTKYTDSTGTRLIGDTLNLKGNKGFSFQNEYKWEFFTSFSDADSRKRATFLDFYEVANGGVTNRGIVVRKFPGNLNSNNSHINDNDYPVYRYAETLLLLAAVENMKGGDPAKYINMIRQRAYGVNYPVYTNGSFADNELAILKERDKEFVLEGKRWFDLRLYQDANKQPLAFSPAAAYPAVAPVIAVNESYKLLWPIDIPTLTNDAQLGTGAQNPGY